MDRRVTRGADTRQHILAVATRMFAELGYEAVSLDAVLKACGISKGALYHHHAGKEALFRAVLEAVEARVTEAVAGSAIGATDPLAALRAGCRCWLELVADDPAVRRIVVTDAAAVLGWKAWREMESRHVLGLLQHAIGAALGPDAEALRVSAYAGMLLAVLNEMAMLIAQSEDRAGATALAGEIVDQTIAPLGALK